MITWPERNAASPSAPSGPRRSTRAGRESQDTVVAQSLQTAGGTPPC